MKYIVLFLIIFLFGCKKETETITGSQPSPPSSPRNLSITPGDRAAQLSWSVPENNGGSSIFEYSIYRGLSNTSISLLTVIGSSSPVFEDTGLVNGTRYFYAVTARNSYGEGSRSNIESSIPFSQFANILEIDSLGNILGGDYTDWCLESNIEKTENPDYGNHKNYTGDAVVLTHFSSSTLGNKIVLNWGTSSEINCAIFEIERANVGLNNYERLGSILGSGTTNQPREYQFNCNYTPSGEYLFRLKEINFSGNFEYFNLSNEVLIGIPIKFSFGPIFRNPVVSISKINFGLPQNDIVSIFFINGSDTNYVLRNQFMTAGYKNFDINKYTLGYNNIFKRVYIKCSSYNSQSDCKNYGDVEFR